MLYWCKKLNFSQTIPELFLRKQNIFTKYFNSNPRQKCQTQKTFPNKKIDDKELKEIINVGLDSALGSIPNVQCDEIRKEQFFRICRFGGNKAVGMKPKF